MKDNYRLEDDVLDDISGGLVKEGAADHIKTLINFFKAHGKTKDDLKIYIDQAFGEDNILTKNTSTDGSDRDLNILMCYVEKYWD